MSQSKLDVIKKKYIKRNNQRRTWILIVIFLSIVTMTITTIQLRSNVSAMSGTLICAEEEHEHTESCYTVVPEAITCGMEEHVHSEECYEEGWELDCTENHDHGVECYKETSILVCDKPEHTHTDACVTPAHKELTCGKTAHVHTESCYKKDTTLADFLAGTPSEVIAEGDDYAVTLQYAKKEDAKKLPNVITREITEEDDEYADLLAQAQAQLGTETVYARFFEITPLQKNMEEGEPVGNTTVTLTLNDYQEITNDTSVSVLHFGENEPTEMDSKVIDNQDLTVTFTTDGFSIFGVVYTVDFHYEANGRTYAFSIPGGGYVTLQQIVEVMNIANSNTYNGFSQDAGAEEEAILTLADVPISDQTREFVAEVEKVEFSNPQLAWIGKIEEENTVGELKVSNGLVCQYSEELTEEQIDEINSKTVISNDWVLISLQPFTTAESLTVTMKNNDVFTINVTDEVTTNPQGTKMDRSAFNINNREDGIIVKLFDYTGTTNSGADIDATWGGDNYSTFRNGNGVNRGRTLIFSGSGMSGSDKYIAFTGQKPNGYDFYSGYRMEGIVDPKLQNGYPVLSSNVQRVEGDDGNLGYLFGAGGQDGVTIYDAGGKGLLGLLRKDENNYYYYSSEDNYARYDGNEFIDLYTDTYFKDKGEAAHNYGGFGAIGFFPFSEYDPSHIEEKGPNGSVYNHQLGMSMQAYFTYPPNGRLNDGIGDPVIFEFSGDDDIWVFVDGTLVLDLGGVHQPIKGVINFETKEVYIYEFDAYSSNIPKNEKVTTIPFSTFFGQNGFDDSDYSTHKFDFFFLERGGCDSNCALKFNFMTLKTAEKTFYKRDKDGDKPLAGATFAVYRDAECTEPLTINKVPLVAVSAEDGSVKLSNLPVRRDSNNKAYPFYMKETIPPAGYERIPTIYTLVYNEGDETYDIIPPGEGAEPITVIYNEKKEIKLTLVKEWVGDPPTDATATFRLKRFVTRQVPETVTLNIYRLQQDTNGTFKLGNQTAASMSRVFQGNTNVTVNWTYDDWMGDNWKDGAYMLDDGMMQYPLSQDITSRNSSSANGRQHVEVQITVPLPSHGEANLYICDGNMGGDYANHQVRVSEPVGTAPSNPPTYISAIVPDESFTGVEMTLDNSTGWTYEFPAQASASLVNGQVEIYSYRIEEVNAPAGYQTVYFDSQGNVVPKANLDPLNTTESGTQTIQNIPSLGVPVDKSWGSEIDDDPSYDWSATFELESIEVHVSGPEYGGANTTQWQPVAGVAPITIRKGQSEEERSFYNLPKYIEYPTTGSLYRIIYSLDETEYNLWHNGNLESSWSKNAGLTGEDFYAPQYPHDAGDTEDNYQMDESDERFYHIIVTNNKSNEHVEDFLTGLKIHKSWPDGTFDSNGFKETDAYASFQLKRYVSKTYRTYTDETNYTPWDNSEPAEEDMVFTNEKHIYTLRKSDNWIQEINNLPKTSASDIHENEQTVYHYTYYFEETGCYPSNYTATYSPVGDVEHQVEADNTTVEAENHETVSAIVVKNWNDNNNASGKRPASLVMTLVADGEMTEHTVTLSETNDWAFEISKLEKYNEENEPIQYSWHEDHIPGYLQTNITRNDNTTTITNTISAYDLTTSYTGTKNWNDMENQYHTRVQDLDIKLYHSLMDPTTGQYGDYTVLPNEYEWIVDSGNNWTYNFDDIPVYDEHGNLILYRAQENPPHGYTVSNSFSDTVYSLGTVNEIGQITPAEAAEKTIQLASDIDLAYCVIRLSQNSTYLIWTHRVPTDEEVKLINEKYRGEIGGRAKTYVSGSGTFDVGTDSISFTVTESDTERSVTLAPHNTSEWVHLYYGDFADDSYSSGETTFTNHLITTNISGTKTWNIRGLTDPANPILTLTRAVEIIDGQNITTSEPEVVTIGQDENVVNLQPKWRKLESSITFTYQDVPMYDQQGRQYIYDVTETSFTIGTGEDMVTYTVNKNEDGSYTANPDKPDAPSYPVTIVVDNSGTNITNGEPTGDLEVIKVEKGYKDSEHVLGGAVFQLTRVNDDNDYNYTGSDAYQSEEQTVDATTGKTTFTNLKPGRYKLEERKSPEGYIRFESAWYITIDSSGTASLENTNSLMSKNEDAYNSFFIENEAGVALPNTGGSGTSLIYLIGCILTILAGVGIVIKRQWKESA